MPVGLFGEAERRRHLTLLTAWEASAHSKNSSTTAHSAFIGLDVRLRQSMSNRLESAIPIDIRLTNETDGPRTVRVELFGRTEIQVPELPASIALVVRAKARDSDFLLGFLDAVIFSLVSGHAEPSAYHAHVLTTDSNGDLSKCRRTFCGIDSVASLSVLDRPAY